MFELTEIKSLNEPCVEPYTLARDRMLSGEEMIVDSEKVVLRAIEAGIKFRSIFATKKYFERHEELFAKLNCKMYFTQHKLMEEIVGHRIHQGLMALCDRPKDTPLEFLGDRIVVLDGVQDVQNVGSIVRSAHAFGVDSMIVHERGCSPFGRRSVRVSMGSVFSLKINHSEDIAGDLFDLKELHGYQVIEAAKRPHAVLTTEAKFSEKSILIIGNEDTGLSAEVQEVCDMTVQIPISPTIDSLNAANAASVLLYAWRHGLKND
jgi:tRNA G18 (ribose-2'-O)-methylase SpoU